MIQRAIAMAEAAGVRVVCLNDVYTLVHDRKLRKRAAMFAELVPKDEAHLFAEAIKRVLDVVLAITSLVLLAPLFFIIAVAIKLTSSGPVFFLQERYGWRRRRFRMWKFRSMVRNAPELMTLLEKQNEEPADQSSRLQMTRVSLLSVASFAGLHSTNYRSYGMCCLATCHLSARGR